MKLASTIVLASTLAFVSQPGNAAISADPTCSDLEFLGIDVHGQHVIRDYVTGGDLGQEWPPVSMRDVIRENGGAVLPGGPGAGYHLPNSVPPGASFCVDAESWHAIDD